MPDIAEPSAEDEPDKHAAWQARREVRHTILRTVAAHLRPSGSATSWQGHRFDLRGITFDLDLDLRDAQFPEGTVLDLSNAVFSAGEVSFSDAVFSAGEVSFSDAVFSGGMADFGGVVFSGGMVNFDGVEFSGGMVNFDGVVFSGGMVSFFGAVFSGGTVSFVDALFSGGLVYLSGAEIIPESGFVGRARGSAGVIEGLPPDRLMLYEADDQTETDSDAGG